MAALDSRIDVSLVTKYISRYNLGKHNDQQLLIMIRAVLYFLRHAFYNLEKQNNSWLIRIISRLLFG